MDRHEREAGLRLQVASRCLAFLRIKIRTELMTRNAGRALNGMHPLCRDARPLLNRLDLHAEPSRERRLIAGGFGRSFDR